MKLFKVVCLYEYTRIIEKKTGHLIISTCTTIICDQYKVSKGAKIRNRYNQKLIIFEEFEFELKTNLYFRRRTTESFGRYQDQRKPNI